MQSQGSPDEGGRGRFDTEEEEVMWPRRHCREAATSHGTWRPLGAGRGREGMDYPSASGGSVAPRTP